MANLTLAQGLLKAQLVASTAELLRGETLMEDHEFLANDLRNKVQEGHDITAEEMLIISDSIRRGRRAAAALAAKASRSGNSTPRTKRGTAVANMTSENLADLLDQAL